VVQEFNAQSEVGSDAAYAAVAWNPQICIDLHLDSAGGASAALLCYQAHPEMGLKILANYCTLMGYRNKGGMLRTPGINGVAVIRIPEAAGIPTALIECGDMDAPDGYNWVRADHREKAAACLCKAICAYAGGTIPTQKIQEDDDMYEASPGKPANIPAYVGNGMKCYLDFTPQPGPSTIRLSFRRDNGDRCAPAMVKTSGIIDDGTARIEVGAYWPDIKSGGVTVKVEVLDGSNVIVTRKQTI
jgi:hypothetical protein